MVPSSQTSARPKAQEQRSHYTELDGLRGLLAVAVMGYHFGLNTLLSNLSGNFLLKGHWGFSVDVFFILSGFVLSAAYFERGMSFKTYMGKRFARLYPLYIFSTLFTIVFLILLGQSFEIQTLILHLFFVQALFNVDSINSPAWSASLEMYVPILCLFTYKYVKRLYKGWNLTLLGLFVVMGIWFSILAIQKYDNLKFARCFIGLFTGVLLYQIYKEINIKITSPFLNKIVESLTACLLAFIILADKWLWCGVLLYPLSCLLILLATNTKSILSIQPIQWLGKWSFSIYLLHKPVMWMFIFLFDTTGDGTIHFKLGMILITVLISIVTYEFIELRLGRKLNRLMNT